MREFWRGRKVLITGQTGFKGSWLAFWLSEMGATVSGVSLKPQTDPNLYDILSLSQRGMFITEDINNRDALVKILLSGKAEIVIHMAAQALVRTSYATPVETFATNVVGTVSLLDAVRQSPSVECVLIVTSDKVYENRNLSRGYREIDDLGGDDPYSASKTCTEIAAQAMRRSFFGKGKHPARIATVRAGNVIGGGDWSKDRLVADVVRGCLGETGVVTLRNPDALRPWQHVLDALSAYLKLAELLFKKEKGYDEAWNVGPDAGETHPVREVANILVNALGKGTIHIATNNDALHESNVLVLDSTKANSKLNWRPVFDFYSTLSMTAEWYSEWAAGKQMTDITLSQIGMIEEANKKQTAGLRSERK